MVELNFSVKDVLKKKREEEKHTFDKIGLDVLKDQGIDARIKLLEEFRTWVYGELKGEIPEDKTKDLLLRLQNIDHILRTVSIPYCAAGGRDTYALIMDAWETTRSLTHYSLTSHLYLMAKAEEEDTARQPSRMQKDQLVLQVLVDKKRHNIPHIINCTHLNRNDVVNALKTLRTYGTIEVGKIENAIFSQITEHGLTVYQGLKRTKKLEPFIHRPHDDLRTALRKEELLRKIEYLWVTFTAKYALLTTDLAWFPEHINRPWAMVVYQPPQYGMGGGGGLSTIPTSGGGTSQTYEVRKPRKGPYPEEMSTDVKGQHE